MLLRPEEPLLITAPPLLRPLDEPLLITGGDELLGGVE